MNKYVYAYKLQAKGKDYGLFVNYIFNSLRNPNFYYLNILKMAC
jgi:hypothetical protein